MMLFGDGGDFGSVVGTGVSSAAQRFREFSDLAPRDGLEPATLRSTAPAAGEKLENGKVWPAGVPTRRFSRARVTQIMNMFNLAPDIQEEILFLPLAFGRGPVTECHLRRLSSMIDGRHQRRLWSDVRSAACGRLVADPPSSLSSPAEPKQNRSDPVSQRRGRTRPSPWHPTWRINRLLQASA